MKLNALNVDAKGSLNTKTNINAGYAGTFGINQERND